MTWSQPTLSESMDKQNNLDTDESEYSDSSIHIQGLGQPVSQIPQMHDPWPA
jgi:hypothetical protein